MPTTNARASNLSLPQYGYDLVVATTQDAINAATKEFLSDFTGKEFVACYKYVKGHAPEPMDYDKVKQAIDGTDPFMIPNGADEKNQKVQKLADLDFQFAFRAKMGLPPGLAPTDIPTWLCSIRAAPSSPTSCSSRSSTSSCSTCAARR